MSKLWPFYSRDAVARVAERVEGGDLSATGLDPDVVTAEQMLAETLTDGAGKVLLLSSGTAALASAYAALNLSPGAEVLVPASTFRATVTAMLPAGLRPVFCDTDPASGNIDLADAERRVTPSTEALVVTHVSGRPVPLDGCRALADRHGLALIEDCSHAHGVHWRGRPVGSVGDAAAFSLGTTKLVSGGTAGALVVAAADRFERALLYGQPKHRVLAQAGDPRIRALARTGVGLNLRASPLAAILVQDHLRRLPETIAVKNTQLRRLADDVAHLLPQLIPVPVPADRTAGTLYKAHYRWTHPEIGTERLVAELRGHGARVRIPEAALPWEPLFNRPELATALGLVPTGTTHRREDYPMTSRFYQGLIEFDTRDLYQGTGEAAAINRAALERVAALRPVPVSIERA